MDKRDIASSLFLMALGIFFVSGSFAYSIWSRHGPEPGFFPLFFGVVLALLSAVLLADRTLRLRREGGARDGRHATDAGRSEAPRFVNPGTIAAYLACCGCVYLAIRPLGFLVTIFLFLIVALPLAGLKSFRTVSTVAAVASVSIFLLFLALNVPLPFGLLQPLADLWRG